MIGSSALRIQGESSLRHFAHQEVVTGLQFVKQGRESALRHEFKEEFQLVFDWGRYDGVGALDALAIVFNPERSVLTGNELELAATAGFGTSKGRERTLPVS